MNLRHLQAVERIATLGTVNAGADAVNLSQPAITQALGRLESALGVPLFERRHDGMIPTPAGEMLVPRISAATRYLRSPHITMSRMRAMIAVAETGSYSGASQVTGLSVPSIHRAIGDLALGLRRALVTRRGKFAIPTAAGNLLAREFRLAQVELRQDCRKSKLCAVTSAGASPSARCRCRARASCPQPSPASWRAARRCG
ncbi:LysR family transcriptional regulator [Novosphingobium sp. P6W]|uniref:helix-turn-helix domain-containing protein n=1 Tax=Novosphingobium sp. P6W TaxID=1609758 RepID=UPI001F0523A9|nr:LysR family transcriptional regulator [Novosphingobium sp. P6W]